jgi:HNH endonuclease
MSVSRRLRFEVLRRDGYTCRYCGARAPDVTLIVDHVVPTTLGGDDDPRNLVTACQPCNAGKSSIPADAALVADVDATALLFAKARVRATEQRLAELQAEDHLLHEFYNYWCETFGGDYGLAHADGWERSVLTFLASGLVMGDLKRFVHASLVSSASLRNTFRYFAGCCWREIGTREEIARRLIEDGDV